MGAGGARHCVFGAGKLRVVLDRPLAGRIRRCTRRRLESEHHRLLAEIRRLRGDNQRLSQRVVLLERTGEIDKRAAGVLDQSLKDEQARLTALKEQVEFYRGIVSPEGYSVGVRVYELEMRRGPDRPSMSTTCSIRAGPGMTRQFPAAWK